MAGPDDDSEPEDDTQYDGPISPFDDDEDK